MNYNDPYQPDPTQPPLNSKERIAMALLKMSQPSQQDDSPWASLGSAANQIAGAFVNKRINDRLNVAKNIKPVNLQMPIPNYQGYSS